MFLDEVTIDVAGGKGGNGSVHWRREKFVPRGGPDGGDGGDGGNVVLLADPNTDTLSDFKAKKRFVAEDGERGKGQRSHGRNGVDLVLPVPPGTVVTDAQTNILADLDTPGKRAVIAKGGRGGFGNAHFKSSVRQRPDFAEEGERGDRLKVRLELKLVADIGIIGLPSVGKSSLISVISSAQPKIADYPFTTLVPNLGVVRHKRRTFVVCDIPGLIEGAHRGKGLGHAFLRHVERCASLVHLLDTSHAIGGDGEINAEILVREYEAIRRELHLHSPLLAKKPELIVLNKIDLAPDTARVLKSSLKKKGIVLDAVISTATREGLSPLLDQLLHATVETKKERKPVEAAGAEALPVLHPSDRLNAMGNYRILKLANGVVRIQGEKLERLAMRTNFEREGAVRRFRDVAKRIGLLRALKRENVHPDDPVYLGDKRIDPYL